MPLDHGPVETLPLRGVLATLSAGAAALHLALAPEHMGHHWTMGLSFYLAAALQLLWSALLLVHPTRQVVVLGALGQAGAVATYFGVHALGWPFGPQAWQPEGHELAGLVCCALEGAAAVAALVLARERPRFGLHAPRLVLPLVGVAVIGLTGGTVAYGGTSEARHHHDGPAPAGAHVHGHHHGTVDTTPPTAAQRRAADRLLLASRESMARYHDVEAAKRAGYKVIHDAGGVLLHYGNPAYMKDGHTLDPRRMESLIYVHLPRAGGDLLVGGMYMVPKGQTGPAIGGSLTPWHAHDDLCLDPIKGIAISQTAAGCPPGSAVGTTGQMMHVWNIDYPGGAFAELDPVALRTAVLEHFGLTPKS